MSTNKKDTKLRGRPTSFNREELLEQVMELFWDHGYNSLSFNEIAQKVNLTRASLYNTFKTKEALFLETLKHYLANTPGAALTKVKKGDSVRDALYDLLKNLIKMYNADHKKRGCMGINCMSELVGKSDDLSIQVSNIYEDLKKHIKKLIEQACEQEELPSNTNTATTAHMVLVFISGLSIFSQSKTNERQMGEIAKSFLLNIGFTGFSNIEKGK